MVRKSDIDTHRQRARERERHTHTRTFGCLDGDTALGVLHRRGRHGCVEGFLVVAACVGENGCVCDYDCEGVRVRVGVRIATVTASCKGCFMGI